MKINTKKVGGTEALDREEEEEEEEEDRIYFRPILANFKVL